MKAYVGRKACGCVTVAVVDEPAERAITAKRVAEYIQNGYEIELVELEKAKLMLKRCTHPKEFTPTEAQ